MKSVPRHTAAVLKYATLSLKTIEKIKKLALVKKRFGGHSLKRGI